MPIPRPFTPVFRWPRDHYSTPMQNPIISTNNGWGPIKSKGVRFDPYAQTYSGQSDVCTWPPPARSGVKKP